MPLRHGRVTRVCLSFLLVLNFGSIAVYILPAGTPSIPVVPLAVEEALGGTVAPVTRAAWPVARRWLDLTATRQHWNLFAPFPSEWTTSLEVVAWYPVEGPAPAADPEVPVSWAADTFTVHGPVQEPYPHWTRHRPFRIVFNMGYEGWGDAFRPVYAAWTCRRLREEGGTSPDGLTLTAVWERVAVPWEDRDPGSDVYRQFLGGFTCADALGEELPPYLMKIQGHRSPAGGADGEPRAGPVR